MFSVCHGEGMRAQRLEDLRRVPEIRVGFVDLAPELSETLDRFIEDRGNVFLDREASQVATASDASAAQEIHETSRPALRSITARGDRDRP
jgi:hypothetical protein